MLDNHDQNPLHSCPSTRLRYAIRSARAVVQALIARDRNAAEEAALRTCRDCDLLIHLIRDVVSVLRDPCNEQLGLSPLETLILARRAEQVLALVEDQEMDNWSSAQPDQLQDVTDQTRQLHGGTFARRTQDSTSMVVPPASQSLTVASTGLRVCLIPVDNNHSTSATDEHEENDCSDPGKSTPSSHSDEH